MPLSAYTNTLVDVSVKPDTTTLRDKSVIITGGARAPCSSMAGTDMSWNGTDPVLSIGASGFGENHARAFVAAG